MHLTQPAVSMQIKQLEGAVDLPLFELMGKRVHLTAAGGVLLDHARIVLGQLKAAEEDLDAVKGIDRGQLKIVIASTVNYFAARLLSRFCREHPSVRVTLDVSNRESLLRKLELNEPDIVLMGRPPDGIDVVAESFIGKSAHRDRIAAAPARGAQNGYRWSACATKC